MSDAPILPDDEPVSLPSMPTMRGGDPATLGRIDHYDLLRKLGGGGFGVVYLARDTASGLQVAIKTLHPLLKHNAEEMDLLREKFALVSRLAHPNIATALVLHPVRDIHVWDEAACRELKLSPGDSVMVMRYAPGVTLSKWRRQFPGGIVPFDRVLEIGRQVASALDYAHDEKIVHRDIKPGNIMVETVLPPPAASGALRAPSGPSGRLSPPGSSDASGASGRAAEAALTRPQAADAGEAGRLKLRVRILDFGLAAEIRSSMSRVSTETGDTSGTRPYMAPEQWLGKKQDGRTDQYALACVTYELLSGAPPFAGVFETGDPVIMRTAVTTDAPDEIDGLDPAANAGLLRALAKSPKDRFPSCAAFVAALGDTDAADEPRNAANPGTRNPDSVREPAERERKEREEAERLAREKAERERKERDEVERLAREKAERERKEREEAERLAREEAERRRAAREEEDRRNQEPGESEVGRKGKRIGWGMGAALAVVAGIIIWGANQNSTTAIRPVVPSGADERFAPTVAGVSVPMHWCPATTSEEWKRISGGKDFFTMGSPSSEDGRDTDEMQHRVTLTKGFWLGETEVTQGLWKKVMGDNPSSFKSGDEYPVEQVSWDDCQTFLKKLNAQAPVAGFKWALPTEAQWEYACRAGTTTAYFWGNALNGDMANCDGNYPSGTRAKGPYKQKTTRVGSYGANPWGFFDMHGNVYEWCADWYGSYPSGAATNPPGASSGSRRVSRGGSWGNSARGCRSAFRGWFGPGSRSRNLGFRVALVPVAVPDPPETKGIAPARRTFTVGFDADFPPYGFRGDDGSFKGFDLDLAREVCRRKGWTFVAQPIDWAAKDAELDAGAIDCIWNGFEMSSERLDKYVWTVPYARNKQVVLVKKDSGIKAFADLDGKVVAVVEGSSGAEATESKLGEAQRADAAFAFKDLKKVPDAATAFRMLQSGAVDALGLDSGVAAGFVKKGDGRFAVLDEALKDEQYGVGFKLGNDALRDEVQETLEKMVADGAAAKIVARWAVEETAHGGDRIDFVLKP